MAGIVPKRIPTLGVCRTFRTCGVGCVRSSQTVIVASSPHRGVATRVAGISDQAVSGSTSMNPSARGVSEREETSFLRFFQTRWLTFVTCSRVDSESSSRSTDCFRAPGTAGASDADLVSSPRHRALNILHRGLESTAGSGRADTPAGKLL